MLTAGVLKLDPEGRVILSSDPAVDFNGGTPIAADGGLSSTPGATPEVFLAGIGYLFDGKLTDSDSPLSEPEGPLSNKEGQVRISTAVPTQWYAGLPLDDEGRLCVSPGIIPPPDLGEFDHGFDNSFDIGD